MIGGLAGEFNTHEGFVGPQSKVLTIGDVNSGKIGGTGDLSQRIVSGVSAKTQQLDAMGKIKHVLMINKSSYGDLKTSSRDRNQHSKRS